MRTAREKLQALIDQMDDVEIERWLIMLHDAVDQNIDFDYEAWWRETEQFRKEMEQKYDRKVFNTVDIIEEMREERLNDIMGGG